MTPKVLILCPTFDHVDTLYASIASVRAQAFREWQLVVIGDGAPEQAKDIVDAITAQDKRVQGIWQPKSERYGEIYRDPVIRESRAEFVCHLSDDDIWMPDHLGEMITLLERAAWANQAPLKLSPTGNAEWRPVNHGTPAMRSAIARGVQLSAGLNYVAYRRDAYLALPEGWTCAPRETGASDAYMWAKFFRSPELAVASSASSTAIKFPSRTRIRGEWTPAQRMAEIAPWLARAATPGLADDLRRSARIRGRMLELFCVHGAGRCPTPQAALELCGFAPAPEGARPRPAINGEPMLLPLTERQNHEASQAWALVRAYAGPDDGAEEARRLVAADFATAPKAWGDAIRLLGTFADAEAARRGTEHAAAVLHN
jgi:hypothetical protein